MRTVNLKKTTSEVDIEGRINLDGKGVYNIKTPNGFLTHMLELLSKHSGIDIQIVAKGDTGVDLHHTMEELGIELGKAFDKALGDRKGIERYSSIIMPMDKTRCDVAIDIGGRDNLVYEVKFKRPYFNPDNKFDYSLIREFMDGFAKNLKATIHIYHEKRSSEENNHHIAEAIFKGLARTLRQAVRITGEDMPSTKGVI
jgi:imidazoleglycerol-phosphate dehydratase